MLSTVPPARHIPQQLALVPPGVLLHRVRPWKSFGFFLLSFHSISDFIILLQIFQPCFILFSCTSQGRTRTSLNLNPRYICALLKKATGTSYLTRLHTERIRATKQYLIETDMTVDEIAQHVGYNSSTQLSRVFKKYENMTPTDYRNSYK